MARILVVDDERSMRELLEILLGKAGHSVVLEEDGQKAMERASHEEYDLVITDLKLGKRSGLEVLERVKQMRPQTQVVMITAFASTQNAIEAMKLGAYDYLIKPFKNDELLVVVEKALEKQALLRENVDLKRKLGERARFPKLLGRSEAMRELLLLIEKVAPARTTVLVTGESGVGKELVARAIHEKSPRAQQPFLAINCGAIPEGLIESELFGHEKGSFTGAVAAKDGLFVAASGGTLFLDEVGELPPSMQVKLLRALQDRRVRAVGGLKDVDVDCRIISATNRDLAAEVRAGRFREDLFYRLNVIGLKVPPLRERREDILVLAEHFLLSFSGDGPRRTLAKEAQALLLDYDFPGNVRELENLVERAVTLAEGTVIAPDVFPPAIRLPRAHAPSAGAPDRLPTGFDLETEVEGFERKLIEVALQQSQGVKKEAARLLGVTFRQLRYKLEKLRMDVGTETE